MYRGHTVGVVVPAYDEAGLVGGVVAGIPSFADRVYVVDDASTDDTWAEVRQVADAVADDPSPDRRGRVDGRVVAIQHDRNRGAGGAIKTGYRHALADEMDVTVTIDADGQMDPARMPRLLDPVVEGRADYAKGNRLTRSDYRRGMPRLRLVGNYALTLLTRVASGYWRTADPQNGYTAISLRALRAVGVDGLYEYYGYCNDVLVRLNAAEMRVVDVPTPAAYGAEESSIRYADYVPRVSGMLLRNFLWRLRARYLDGGVHALAVCYALGGVAAVAGLTTALSAAWAAVAGGSSRGPVVAALALGLVGCLLVAAGMALDRRENRHLEVPG